MDISLSANHARESQISMWGWLIAVFSILLHFGINEFISVQFLSFVVLYALGWKICFFKPKFWAVFIYLSVLGCVGVILSDQDGHYYLVSFRVASAVALLYAYCHRPISDHQRQFCLKNIVFAIEVCIILNILLASAQFLDSLYLHSGKFDLPTDWFALDYGTTFAGRREGLANSGYFIRPSGFYSEPSALAAFGLLGFYVANFIHSKRLVLLSLTLIALSMSMSGLLLLGAFIIFFVTFRIGMIGAGRGRSYAILLLVIAGMMLFIGLGARTSRVLSGDDISALIRVLEPIRIIAKLISDGKLFGANNESLMAMASVLVNTIFDNWLLNQMMMYGLVGVLFIVSLFFIFPVHIWPLFLTYGVINGDLFYYDRLILMVMACLVARSALSQGKSKKW